MVLSKFTSKTALVEKIHSLQKLVGNTPLLRIKGVYDKPGIEIYAKLEWQQFGGSVKARPAFEIIKNAVEAGHLGDGRTLLDATSGNTGIAFASISAALGIPLTLCLPENASPERKRILKSLGAQIVFTSRFEGTDGSQEMARTLADQNPDLYFYADQYNNDSNWKAHVRGTSQEIWHQTAGRITHFVTGLGTTGTFTGTSVGLKNKNNSIATIALHPDNPMHGLEGWKHLETAKVPGIYRPNIADQDLEIDTLEAYEMIRTIAKTQGLLVSPSSAANLVGAVKVAENIDKGVIVTTFPDNAEKYSEVINHVFEA
ncbi:MAG: cysteine synthase family protein [Saprospiraceae bacterium]|nr:cysteine synthase family protein [Saprospiraceae bacterium]